MPFSLRYRKLSRPPGNAALRLTRSGRRNRLASPRILRTPKRRIRSSRRKADRIRSRTSGRLSPEGPPPPAGGIAKRNPILVGIPRGSRLAFITVVVQPRIFGPLNASRLPRAYDDATLRRSSSGALTQHSVACAGKCRSATWRCQRGAKQLLDGAHNGFASIRPESRSAA